MKVACPSCRALFEIDASIADGPGLPLCDACSGAGIAPPPPPLVRRPRPKVPAIEFGKRRPKAEDVEPARGPSSDPISLDDLDISSSPPSGGSELASEGPSSQVLDGGFARSSRRISVLPSDPGPLSQTGAELSMSELASDVEPVSLRDLGVVLGPAAAPPAWTGAPRSRLDDVASALKPRATRAEEPPPQKSTRDGESSGLMDIRKLTATAAARVEPANGKPSFFETETKAPVSDDIPIDVEEPAPSSDPLSWKTLLGPSSDDEPPRSSGSLLNLSGGLFGDVQEPLKPIELEPTEAPQITAPIAPVLRLDRAPPSVRVPAAAREETEAEDEPRSPKSGAPGPVVSERRPARRTSTLGWMTAVVAGAALMGFVAARLSTPREDGRDVVVTPKPTTTAEPPPRLANDARDVQPARVIEPAPPPASASAAPIETGRAVEPARSAAPVPTATSNRATPPQVSAVAVTPPVTVAPAPVPPPVTAAPAPPPVQQPVAQPTPQPAPPPAPAPAPAPGGGGEFNTAAAKTALAAAASAASGCKDPDDPSGSGGARVSVTFAPSGRVTSSRVMGPPFQGTKTGGCIARAFRTITVPAFSGDPVTINTQVSVR